MKSIVGHFSSEVIDKLNLNIAPNTPIYIGESNIEHIKSRHPYEFDRYFSEIENIITNPDYVGVNPSDGSIGYVKIYQLGTEYIRLAVRATVKGTCFVKSLHMLSTCNAERYIERGTLKKLDK